MLSKKSFLLYSALISVLTACGGGGGGNNSGNTNNTNVQVPLAPVLSLTPQAVKLFKLSWNDTSNETEYRIFENADGSSGFTQIATSAQNIHTYFHTAPLTKRLNAKYMVQACNSGGCTDSNTVSVSTNLKAAIGYFKSSNSEAGDVFGESVAISGDGKTLVVGASGEDSIATGINGNQSDNSLATSGAIYVFVLTNNDWTQQAYIKASNTDAGDAFGRFISVSTDGNTIAVGANQEDSDATGVNGNQGNGTGTTDNSGAVYIFTRSGTTWSQQAYIKASNTEQGDLFGQTVSLSGDGNTLAVGATGEDSNATGINGTQADNSAAGSGAVYVFTRSSTTWSQQAYIKASNTGVGDTFGLGISLSEDGNTMSVGAYKEASNATGINGNQSDDSASYSGAAYVFTRSGSTWSQQAYIKASNTGNGDQFGEALSLSKDGNTLAVGARSEDSDATGIGGNQGNSISMANTGAVYIYTRSGSTWSQQAYIKASNTGSGDQFGYRVGLSSNGNTLVVTANQEKSASVAIGGDQNDDTVTNAGAAYVFERSSGTWSQTSYVKASNTGSDFFGASASISNDGNSIAIGAYAEASNSQTPVVGDQLDDSAANSGAVYLY